MKNPLFDKVYGPDQVTWLHYAWPTILIFLIFLFSFLALAYLPDFNEWMNEVWRKSDQQKTGWIMLGIGCPTFVILFLTGCLRK